MPESQRSVLYSSRSPLEKSPARVRVPLPRALSSAGSYRTMPIPIPFSATSWMEGHTSGPSERRARGLLLHLLPQARPSWLPEAVR